jgi:hypothetical protein
MSGAASAVNFARTTSHIRFSEESLASESIASNGLRVDPAPGACPNPQILESAPAQAFPSGSRRVFVEVQAPSLPWLN